MLNLLAVDDDSIDRMTLRRALKKGGVAHRLFEAADGFAALEILRGTTMPRERRLVLLDINMPRMNGLEFMRLVRADEALRHTPLLMLTTSVLASDREEAHRLNCAGYFVKPLGFDVFVEVLRTIDQYWSRVTFPP
ncbi:MAG: two-component system response regulator [Archangium gephyra]|uniref:Two-component system response regulator n=1 Tax=Archangium gephyra TaxID=48 RepID=A0A2W5SUA4_9BACT|nr:MAG: two-component system response regulator [Archangium gephyra]